MNLRDACFSTLLAALAAGCALQVAGGVNRDFDRGYWPVYGSAEGRFHNVRAAGSVFGWRTQFEHQGRKRPLHFRSLGFVAGYRIPRLFDVQRLSIEPGIDLMIGSPALAGAAFGPGFYAGAHLIALLRLFGDYDQRDVFALLIANFDLFVTGRFGVWSAQEAARGATERGELALELGLRVTVTSDVLAKESQEDRR